MSRHDDFLDDYIGYRIFEDSMKGSGSKPLKKNTGCGCGTWTVLICIVIFLLGVFGFAQRAVRPAIQAQITATACPIHSIASHPIARHPNLIQTLHQAVSPPQATPPNLYLQANINHLHPQRNPPIPTTPNPTLTRMISTTTTVMTFGITKMQKITSMNTRAINCKHMEKVKIRKCRYLCLMTIKILDKLNLVWYNIK